MEDPSTTSLQSQLHQKRQYSTNFDCYNHNIVKRRLAEHGIASPSLNEAEANDIDTPVDLISHSQDTVVIQPDHHQISSRLHNVVLPQSCFLGSGGEGAAALPRIKDQGQQVTLENPSKLAQQPPYECTPRSPYYLPTTSSSNMEAAAKAIDSSSIKQVSGTTLHDSRLQVPSKFSQSPSCVTRLHRALSSHNLFPVGNEQHSMIDKGVSCGYFQEAQIQRQSPMKNFVFTQQQCSFGESRCNDANANDNIDNNDEGNNITSNNNNSNSSDTTNINTNSNTSREGNNNVGINSSSESNEDGDNGDNNHNVSTVAVPSKPSSQTLVEKLQEIYKNIVKQETELQERCSQLTTSQTTDLKNLWVIYKLNAELIDNYFTFITTALLPTQPKADLLIGQEIIEVYRIERRLWLYGTITFLDVLKNFSNFMDPEVCCQFIVYVFISISNILGNIPPTFSVIWLERLGDLSRMAIALYPSGFIDWKLSAEHWYQEALKYNFGHGKLYYHMSTVQQNTLAAFVNLGKSVFCRDTFIPSQQYMQLVIDNIYQRAFAERNSGHHRYSHIVEYLKHTEVMLLPSFLENVESQGVVLAFFDQKFGATGSANFFDPSLIFVQDCERLKHFFRHASLYAESHILQLVGFGDPRNPFALLFELPKCIKERKERKEKRKSKSTASNQSDMSIDDTFLGDPVQFFETLNSTKTAYRFSQDLNIWKESLNYVNKTSMRCSMVVLRKFLNSSLLTALPHLLPWAYFLVAVGLRLDAIRNEDSKRFWIVFIRQIFPWESITNFLNVLLLYINDQKPTKFPIDEYMANYINMPLPELLEYFCENEDLPEVWNCWGTLWFDVINSKHVSNLVDIHSTGVKDHMFLDAPVDGISFDHSDESGEKFWKRCVRVILLFRGIAYQFPFGFTEFNGSDDWKSLVFKFNEPPAEWKEQYLGSFSKEYGEFESISFVNTDLQSPPHKGMVLGTDIRTLQGYKQLVPDYLCFNKNGDLITGSLYTSGMSEGGSGVPNDSEDFGSTKRLLENELLVTSERRDYNNLLDKEETPIIDEFLKWRYSSTNSRWEQCLPRGDLQYFTDTHVTYFVLDATTWLRHFGHVYKLATSNLLKFAICLTTFQELRFLRKSKDESVLEAATRAVITVRQLYYERKLLPLRFTGNVAGHLEEHLEIEEQMTWRSHVDEFVIEAIDKAQSKFNQLNKDAKASGRESITTIDDGKFNFIALVTDDINMRNKARAQSIRAFSTKFMFAICHEIGLSKKVCTD
ncbi:uncharacterized protein Ecym_4015 [Eremothecium cymbalariae DBVPG|uniref:PIN domain-containing protein n=1 Tax=Eremothecium cymbalariae (strain CBS 270.75 / DBVPG 7215 / KCTC 17166 / NRRL Y-17582) TaxID=931890 RepID=G8JSU6_ERECY|nr:hypothetical protein Ecym_4015 [Eremothecium cymbalariae DBVPG\